MAEKYVAGAFVVVPELLAKIRASFKSTDETPDDIIRTAKKAPLLVLDDLGAENSTDWVLEQLFLVINHRYEYMLPTIITTNCNGRELEQRIGRRILSRIAEMTDPIQIKAADYRMKKFA
jgi:DNA replication protein DnaC